jgi:hypothetical protein
MAGILEVERLSRRFGGLAAMEDLSFSARWPIHGRLPHCKGFVRVVAGRFWAIHTAFGVRLAGRWP